MVQIKLTQDVAVIHNSLVKSDDVYIKLQTI